MIIAAIEGLFALAIFASLVGVAIMFIHDKLTTKFDGKDEE